MVLLPADSGQALAGRRSCVNSRRVEIEKHLWLGRLTGLGAVTLPSMTIRLGLRQGSVRANVQAASSCCTVAGTASVINS